MTSSRSPTTPTAAIYRNPTLPAPRPQIGTEFTVHTNQAQVAAVSAQ